MKKLLVLALIIGICGWPVGGRAGEPSGSPPTPPEKPARVAIDETTALRIENLTLRAQLLQSQAQVMNYERERTVGEAAKKAGIS
jgi:hypothetical protein